MQQEIQTTVKLTYSADAALSRSGLRDEIRDDLARIMDPDSGAKISCTGFNIHDIREEAAIYGTEQPAPVAPGELASTGQAAPSAPLYEGTGAPVMDWLAHVNDLRHAVARLRDLYDAHPICNEIQPRELGECFAASLDEWAEDILHAEQNLRYLGTFYAKLESHKFGPEFAGAGCTMLAAYRGGAAVWLSNKDGGSYPTPQDWNVAVYRPDDVGGEAVWNITSGDGADIDASSARFYEAVSAALATAEAIGRA